MSDKEAEQNLVAPHETPVFKSTDVEPALKSLKSLITKLSKKPIPKKEKPAKADNSTEEASGDGDDVSPAAEGGEAEVEEGVEADGEAGEGEEEETDSLREDEL